MLFAGDGCKMMEGNAVLAEGRRIEAGIYEVPTEDTADQAMLVRNVKTIDEYHKIMGHANRSRIKILLKSLGIEKVTDNDEKCSDCPAGKGTQAIHPSVGRKAEEPDTINVDLAHVNKPSLEGLKYYMVCKDESTEFSLVTRFLTKPWWRNVLHKCLLIPNS